MLDTVRFLGYRRVNSTKCPVSEADNVSKHKLMSKIAKVREVVCA
jgi:hypothetical protein